MTILLTCYYFSADDTSSLVPFIQSCNQSMVNGGFVFLFQAIFAYWITSNLFTVGQVAILSHPAARKAMGIPEMVPYESANSGSFWENLKAGE